MAVVLQREPFAENPDLEGLYGLGTEARRLRYFTERDGTHRVILQGIGRLRLRDLPQGKPHQTVTVDRVVERLERGPGIDARFHQLRERGLEILGLIEQAPPELTASFRAIDRPGALADFITGLLDLTPVDKQQVLDTIELPLPPGPELPPCCCRPVTAATSTTVRPLLGID